MSNLNDICRREIKSLNSGEVFLLRDFLNGYKRNILSRDDHLLLGTLSLSYVNATDREVITIEKIFSSQYKNLKATGVEYISKEVVL